MQSGIFLLRYRTEMTDAGMQMPALVLRMPMPNYAYYTLNWASFADFIGQQAILQRTAYTAKTTWRNQLIAYAGRADSSYA
jgi:hypothetical protein